MTRLMTAAAALCLLVLPSAALAAGAEDSVKAAYAAWDAAFNEGDAKAVAATYDEEALFLPATHDVVEGRAKVETFFEGLFKMGVTNHKLEVIDVMDRGDTVVAAARWTATGKDADGKDADWGGVATHVFRKDGDSLTLILHTFN